MDLRQATDAIERAAASGGFVSVKEYSRTSTEIAGNEFLLFLKPDLTLPTDRLERVWALVWSVLERFDCRLAAAAACGADYLRRHRIFEDHYGVINQVSSRGLAAVTESGRRRIDELIEREGGDIEVLGGHQFLERFSAYTAEWLAATFDSLPLQRFAGGTHGVLMTVDGQRILLLDGFHPYQLQDYYAKGRTILNLVLRSPAPWRALRQELGGATNPAKADPRSIRGLLLHRKEELGLPEVSPMRNGVHVSAGPIEAVVEISRFMSNQDAGHQIQPEDTTLGHELARIGGSPLLRNLCANGQVRYGGETESAFDLTEEWDSSALLRAVIDRAIAPQAD
jgi:hypothetical protein